MKGNGKTVKRRKVAGPNQVMGPQLLRKGEGGEEIGEGGKMGNMERLRRG